MSTSKKNLMSTQFKENRKSGVEATALAIPTLDLKEIKKVMENFKDHPNTRSHHNLKVIT
jgi:hypothetical protein